MASQETVQGCPAQYKARYVDWRVVASKSSPALSFGTLIHDVLYRMETDPIGPEEALSECWPIDLELSHWREAVDLLNDYLARGGPMAKYGTLAVELGLYSLLYEDEEFGPVYFGGRLDWLGVDLENPSVLHLVDYKTNQFPPSLKDVQGDIQLMSYDWLVRQNWAELGMIGEPTVVSHLDAVRWREIEHVFDKQELDEWQEWASAIARKLLRDKDGKEELNAYCGWCPIKLDCKAFQKLPGEGESMLERRTKLSLDELVTWRDDAAAAVKVLKSGIDEVDEMLKVRATQISPLVVGDSTWTYEPRMQNELDKEALLELIGSDDFVRLAGFSKSGLDAFARSKPELKEEIKKVWSREPNGMTVARKKAKDDKPAV